MSQIDTCPTASESPSASSRRPLLALLTRLHFYIGLFVGPFLLVAAVSGIFYALSPQLEPMLYAKALYTDSRGDALPLARQVDIAEAYLDHRGNLFAVRPAPEVGETTRVQFSEPGLRPSESRAIFIDPVTGEVKGNLVVYGTSGVLPLRGLLDQFHRGLLLGDVGRLYSELAASWLWIAALGGLVLWIVRRRQASFATPRGRLRRWHARLGLVLMIGLLFFSATGLTWSQYAGDNISLLRKHYGWSTPTVATRLDAPAAEPADEHSEHRMHAGMAMEPRMDNPRFDQILAAARTAGIDAAKVEIRPARSADRAWTVTEIDRRWPTQVDAVSIDPKTLATVDRVRFADYPLAAKLTRWGIDSHMGVLFGLPNQLLLSTFAAGLALMVIWGYRLWWRRRPTLDLGHGPLATLRRLPWAPRLGVIALSVGLGFCLPVLGGSLLLFLTLDSLLVAWHRSSGRAAPAGA